MSHYMAASGEGFNGKFTNEKYGTLTAILDQHEANILSEIVRLKGIAGPSLDHFECLTLQDIQTFEERVRSHWKLYKKAMRHLQKIPDPNLRGPGSPGISTSGQRQLREFTRLWTYAKRGEDCLDLPEPEDMNVTNWDLATARLVAAARLLWVQVREEQGKDVYESGTARYTEPAEDPAYLHGNLKPEHKWLLDFTVVPTYETHILLHNVLINMRIHKKWRQNLEDILDLSEESGLLKTPQVEEFTTPWTREAMQVCDERGNSIDCPICSRPYSFADGRKTGRATKTACNHVLGAQCLQNWVDLGKSTCPICRRPMYGVEHLLPDTIRASYTRFMEIFKITWSQIDELVDSALKEGNVEIHAGRFADLMQQMSKMNREAEGLIGDMILRASFGNDFDQLAFDID
jgi:hypothetical protein